MKEWLLIITIWVFLLAALVFTPFLTIWSLNLLFGLGIAYNLKTWLAVWLLSSIISPSMSKAVDRIGK